jgi:ATP:cob(I)alamin adenosyltransferase
LVTLNRIYTRTGDDGSTRLATGQKVSKADRRVEAYGAVDETNACLGLARLHTGADPVLDPMLARVQNELFDLGADLSTPAKPDEADGFVLRILDSQVKRLEDEIDELNGALPPLASFVLPGGASNVANNYNHLMEQPTIFYATALALAVAGLGAGLNLWLAWGYVALRVVHSLVQATTNVIMVRFSIFMVASLVLLVLAVRAALAFF